MAVILPDKPKTVIDRIRADVKAVLPNSNPSLKEGMISAETEGFGRRVFDAYSQIKNLVKQLFPFNAVDEYLQFWADLKRLTPDVSTGADGAITITGTLATVIPAGTVFTIDTLEYTTDDEVTIETNIRDVSSLVFNGTSGFCQTILDHGFSTGNIIAIDGADFTEYNGNFQILTINDSEFQFTSSATPGVAAGTITATLTSATSQVSADLTTATDEQGGETNQASGTTLELQSAITGVNGTAIVQVNGLTGGLDDETAADYRVRIVTAWQNPITPFNSAYIKRVCKAIDGVTRVWVDEVTPEAGQVTIYFVRDNDTSIIPESSDVDIVRAEILKLKEAHTEDDDVITPIITAYPQDITLSNLEPNTISMRTAIENTINSFYRGSMDKGEDHDPEKLRGAIYQTFDVQAGEKIESFTMDAPTVIDPVPDSGIATHGTLIINN